jgi:PadR family transcriptional regulator PadR
MRGRRGRRRQGPSRGVVRFVEPALLLDLRSGPAHGYTLLERLREFGMAGLNPTIVYRVLRNMENQGLVESDWNSEGTQGPPRRVYSITPLGRDLLASSMKDLRQSRALIDRLVADYISQLETEQSVET